MTVPAVEWPQAALLGAGCSEEARWGSALLEALDT